MNKMNRKALTEANDMLTKAVAIVEDVTYETEYSFADTISAINEVESILQDVYDDEEMKYDNLTEGLQASEMGERMYEAMENIENAIKELNGVKDVMYDEFDGGTFLSMLEGMETASVYIEDAIYC